MQRYPLTSPNPSFEEIRNWTAVGSGVALVAYGARQRSFLGVCAALASVPLFYRGMTGEWPDALAPYLGSGNTRVELAGDGGVDVRESIRVARPLTEVYAFWRNLSNLPRFMGHLDSVIEESPTRSRWVALGPADVRVVWDAEIINEVPDRLLAWRSLPGSDVSSAGSVRFDTVREGRSTEVRVHLQYSPPAGRAGALLAKLFGRAPSQTIREDLRRFKQLLEAGEIARAGRAEVGR